MLKYFRNDRTDSYSPEVIVLVVEFFNKTLSNALQTMKMQADNTDTQNEHQCKQSTVLSVKHQQSIYIIIEQQVVNEVFAHEL